MLKIQLTLYDLIPKTVKLNPAIRWLLQTNCLSVFDHSEGSSLLFLQVNFFVESKVTPLTYGVVSSA